MSMTTLLEQLEAVDDPRCAGKVGHRLGDILLIAVCAVIACAESWEDIALYGRTKRAWLESFLELPCGIPSHDTFRRVFVRIDPDRFEAAFLSWVRGLTQDFTCPVNDCGYECGAALDPDVLLSHGFRFRFRVVSGQTRRPLQDRSELLFCCLSDLLGRFFLRAYLKRSFALATSVG
jgi:hypothetical protein